MTIKPLTYAYKTVGDCQVKADVYWPSECSASTAVIVHIHGGCLIYGSRKDIHQEQLALYLEACDSVVSIDCRLAPGTKLPEMIADPQDPFQWITDAGPSLFAIDPQRITVVGHSAGGYLALMSRCCVVPRPKVIVSFYGYGDIVGDWYSRPDPLYCQQPMVSEVESGRLVKGPVISEPYEGCGKEKPYTLPGRGHGLDDNMDDPLVKDAFNRLMVFLDKHIGSAFDKASAG